MNIISPKVSLPPLNSAKIATHLSPQAQDIKGKNIYPCQDIQKYVTEPRRH